MPKIIYYSTPRYTHEEPFKFVTRAERREKEQRRLKQIKN